jgi:hypothetical protein
MGPSRQLMDADICRNTKAARSGKLALLGMGVFHPSIYAFSNIQS